MQRVIADWNGERFSVFIFFHFLRLAAALLVVARSFMGCVFSVFYCCCILMPGREIVHMDFRFIVIKSV